jgi:uncharacterized protein (TIGR00369 family)
MGQAIEDAYTRHLEYRAFRSAHDRVSTWIPVRPDLLDEHGALHPGVIGYLVDSSAGLVCGLVTTPRWIVTADLEFSLLAPATVGPVRADAHAPRPGTAQVLGDVRVYDEGNDDRLVAVGTVNHIGIEPREQLGVLDEMPVGSSVGEYAPRSFRPLTEHLALRSNGSGRAEIDIEGDARNPLGILHGGIITLLCDDAARGTVRSAASIDGRALHLAVRFLAPLRHGPALATGELVLLDERRAVVRVEVIDLGRDGRLGAIGTVEMALA